MSRHQDKFEVIVIGMGGMGTATTYHLARRGIDVLGLEQYDIPHSKGSSHGSTRVIRKAYHEDASYVSLLHRAYELWEQLETERDERLLYKTGSVSAGPPTSELVTGATEACEEHSLPYDKLSAGELSERVPGFELPDGFEAVYQPDGGFVDAQNSVVAHVERAHAHGAEIHGREAVEGWQSTTDGVRVTTEKGSYSADRLVISAGAWTGELVETDDFSLSPERQALAWIQPEKPDLFSIDSFPAFGVSDGENLHYGTPVYGVPGVKIGRHHHFEQDVDPDEMDREPTDRDERVLRDFADSYLRDGAGPTMGLKTCIYTNSPDENFVIDRLPNHSNVVVAGGFSGHGYKFASVVGEIAADLAADGTTSHDIDLFSLDRF
ncbi:N-methyl-L-tryptophan oxidase [Halostella pelagica]|uniref:N-methyl-L-tryptophan oxidase n=1 Tax=Halostella pelagica TaxID=2583824 RepID=UPI0010802C75|nr:N-methyl-L-tryptophan oxidase [Halostella pelagica]